ncbi:hypothetical protein [Lysobacter arvi]|uniref:DUF1440 domain-containing protein n=1 Tax=Lysobacter arvi TaxID=3038776 RepID=A0ABU1CDT4_9GAMM|nr:hypothetical protein [Lysobacter arvi]MDR0183336.1 hypothetical protein [Lysobacter arvi]
MRGMTARALAWGVLGGLLAGTLDLVYATGFWALRDVPAQRILQSIAAGALGRAAFAGGWTTALLGLSLHCLIAAAMGLAYAFAARDVPALRDRPWRYGALYGLVLYAFMNFVVVPLSASPRGGALPMSWVAWSVVAHVVLVGWPCAWFARRGWDGRWRTSRASPRAALADLAT